MTINITEQTRIEQVQRDGEERYRTLFESVDEGICVVEMLFDEQGQPFDYRFLETNPAFERQTGLAQAIGKTARELVPNLEGHWIEIYGKVALTGEGVRFVDGSEAMNRWFDVYAVRLGGTESRQVAIFFTDITERKHAERALRESEQRLRLAAGAANLGVFEWSVLEDQAFWENDRMYEIFGRAREDGTISKAEFYESCLHPEDVAMFEGALLESMKPGNSLYVVCRIRRKSDDELRWLEFAGNVELAPDGTPLRLTSVIADITERKHADEALRESEERFRAIVVQAAAGVAQVDLSGKYVLVNERYCEIVGYPREELLGLRLHDITHEEDLPGNLELVGKLVNDGTSFQVEKRYVRKDGTIVWVNNSVAVIRDASGKPQSILAVTFDITERKQAEDAVRESEARFRNMADNAPVMIWITDTDGACTYLSQSWYDFTGQTPETGLGLGWVKAVHPEDSEASEMAFLSASEKHQDFRVEYRLRSKHGEYRWAIDSAAPRFGSRGEFLGFIGSVIDITERKAAEEAQAERARLAVLIGDVGIALTRNETLQNILRLCTEAMVRHLDAAFARIWTLNEVEQVLELQASSGMYTHLDGAHSRVPVGKFKIGLIAQEREPHLTNSVIGDPRVSDQEWAQAQGMVAFAGYPLIVEDRLVGVMAMFARHALTEVVLEAMTSIANGLALGIERKRVEEERERLLARESELRAKAEEANRLKDEFLATVSHELRTPLTAIIGWSSLLRSGKLDEASSANGLETIERNAKAQSQLIEDLMDVSRVITGNLRLDVSPVNLISVVETAVDAVRLAAEAKAIRLQILLDPSAGPISGDSARLQQIIWNLLSNAIKFTPKGGRVQLRLERVNSHLEIIVSDTGQGVSPEFLPYVFDRFRQADAATTRRHGGLGLGLAIVRHLVELHGGTVRVDSPGEGQGATFTVSLPLMIVHREPDGEERRHPKAESAVETVCPPELDGLRVLVVDDEPDARRLLAIVLEQCGAEVTTAGSVPDALVAFGKSRPDVIVSDIGMPEEDGYSFIRQIRALPDNRGGRIPAAALTAYASAEDRKRALLAGFQLHVPKPVEPTELIAVVATLAGRTGRS